MDVSAYCTFKRRGKKRASVVKKRVVASEIKHGEAKTQRARLTDVASWSETDNEETLQNLQNLKKRQSKAGIGV